MPQNFAAADPLIALGERWETTRSEITDADSDAVCDTLSARLHGIEQQMIPLVAMTPQGLAAQLQVLRHHPSLPDDYALMVENMLTGLQYLLS